jgi:hypothetical protein
MLDLNKKTNKTITKPSNKDLKPKSFRCNQSKLNELEEFRLRLEQITHSHKCSDAKAIHIAITIANMSTEAIIKKAVAENL